MTRMKVIILLFIVLGYSIKAVQSKTSGVIEFPKIMWGDPMDPFYDNSDGKPVPHPQDFINIDSIGANLILSTIDPSSLSGSHPYQLDPLYNIYRMPVIIRPGRINSDHQEHNGCYNPDDPASMSFGWYFDGNVKRLGVVDNDGDTGWRPQILLDTYLLDQEVYVYGRDMYDELIDRNVIGYDRGISGELIFTTEDEQVHDPENPQSHNFLYRPTWKKNRREWREIYIRLKIKSNTDQVAGGNGEIVRINLWERMRWGSRNAEGFSLSEDISITTEDIRIQNAGNYSPGEYYWVETDSIYKNDPSNPEHPCIEVSTLSQNQALSGNKVLQMEVINASDGNEVYIDSIEIWEKPAYDLIYCKRFRDIPGSWAVEKYESYLDVCDMINGTGGWLQQVFELDLEGLIWGFDQPDVFRPRFTVYDALDSLIYHTPFGQRKYRLIAENVFWRDTDDNSLSDVHFTELPAQEYFDYADLNGESAGIINNQMLPWTGAFYSDSIQLQIDYLIGHYDPETCYGNGLKYMIGCANNADFTPWAMVQVHHERYSQGGTLRFRNPSNCEIALQTYLSLAFGVKGIGYFLYYSRPFSNPCVDDAKLIGVFQHNGIHWEAVDEFNSPGIKDSKFQLIRGLNAKIDILAPTLLPLKWQRNQCVTGVGNTLVFTDSLEYIDNVRLGGSQANIYSEICEFTLNSADIPCGEYFMITNRSIDSDVDPATIEVIINLASDFDSYFFLENMYSHDVIEYSDYHQGYFIDLNRGEGKLFRITDQYKWQGTIALQGDFSPAHRKLPLVIAPGTEVRIYNSDDIDRSSIILSDDEPGMVIDANFQYPVVFTQHYHTKAQESRGIGWDGIFYNDSVWDSSSVCFSEYLQLGDCSESENTWPEVSMPGSFELQFNYPNPFNSGTNIYFDLPVVSSVIIDIYNISGQRVSTIIDNIRNAGHQSVSWNGRASDGTVLSSGVYICKFQAVSQVTGEHYQSSRKILLVK